MQQLKRFRAVFRHGKNLMHVNPLEMRKAAPKDGPIVDVGVLARCSYLYSYMLPDGNAKYNTHSVHHPPIADTSAVTMRFTSRNEHPTSLAIRR